ncbi:MDIS1-interacting receptor like kinase 2-like isoform X3 [Rosa rugosa]|uniref:MDIS1-interacting receptor like kinase 2-like isoform X3 n=1 Tax=Rosa rugosa TaxID=74645 RepID=UPI002B4055A3|nr:MDIS1-interacting receptor like kinase 2-like isoform X3 [Rosa rugosa]
MRTSAAYDKVCSVACLILYVHLISSPKFASASAETNALLKWKASFQNQTQPDILTSWTYLPIATNSSRDQKANASPCFWTGISCNAAGSISRINLTNSGIPGNNITGTIPPEIGNLTQLQLLNLSSNHLVGNIPVELGRLTSLGKLILKDNQLSGGIPQELGSLTELEYLDLSTNKLSQSIPSSLGNFLKLHHINASNNKLSQKIPFQFRSLTQLSVLDLSHNGLDREIPTELSNLKSLVTLNLSHNNLSGVIPKSFDELRGLDHIDISYNQFWGPIPNNKAFHEAPIEALKGNKGLCGNVTGFLPCIINPEDKKHSSIYFIL